MNIIKRIMLSLSNTRWLTDRGLENDAVTTMIKTLDTVEVCLCESRQRPPEDFVSVRNRLISEINYCKGMIQAPYGNERGRRS